jgi:hypothetical protein
MAATPEASFLLLTPFMTVLTDNRGKNIMGELYVFDPAIGFYAQQAAVLQVTELFV